MSRDRDGHPPRASEPDRTFDAEAPPLPDPDGAAWDDDPDAPDAAAAAAAAYEAMDADGGIAATDGPPPASGADDFRGLTRPVPDAAPSVWAALPGERPLDHALGQFMRRLDPGLPDSLRHACVLLAQLEGRGHSCLVLDELFGDLTPLADPVPGAVDALAERVQRMLGGCRSADELSATWRDRPVVEYRPAVAEHSDGVTEAPPHAAGCQGLAADGGEDHPDLPGAPPLVLHGNRLYLRRYWQYERAVASALRARIAPAGGSASAEDTPDADLVRQWLDRLFASESTAAGDDEAGATSPSRHVAPVVGAAQALPSAPEFDWQRAACALAVRGRFSVVTGGPGTGKTYTAARLLVLLHALHTARLPGQEPLRIALAAPTGKAAARLRQSIEQALQALEPMLADVLPLADFRARLGEARTLHRLLGARTGTRRLQHGPDHPLDIDVLFVDEASMVHLEMMANLLQALPAHARLVLLGDKDQLASVEAGAVLGELCAEAQAGHYDAATCDWLQACTGMAVPEAQRLSTPKRAEVTDDAPGDSTLAARAARPARPRRPPPMANASQLDLFGAAAEATDEASALAAPPPPSGQLPASPHVPDASTGPGRAAHNPLAGQTVMLRRSRRFGGAIGALAAAVNAGQTEAAAAVLAGADRAVHWLRPGTTAHAAPAQALAQSLAGLLKLALHGRAVPVSADKPSGHADGFLAYWQVLQQRPAARSGRQDAHFEAWVRTVLRQFDAFRLLTPVREGPWGVAGLNRLIETALVQRGRIRGRSGDWYEGRPIIVTRNDPDLGVFNGDVGLVIRTPADAGAAGGVAPEGRRHGGGLRAWFADGDQLRSVAVSRLAEVETAYAMTVHKSQGSEFAHVALVLPPEPNPVLTRELVYTGITRARETFTLVGGDERVWRAAVERRTRRNSGLAALLKR